MDGYTGKCRGKTTERSRERGWRNVDGGTGECRTVVNTLGADLMEKVDSWEKVSRNEKRVAKHNSCIPKAPYHHAAAGTESRYAHSSELPAKIDDQKKSR
ncbi:hypothetical protein D3C80_1570490 [compost metagenome]